jgi:EAL domain-containing protein (putative c-di-GMP-specific phosphodiesterase class I)
MVRSINDIGQVMGKVTIAEYVESAEILEELKRLGVDYVQGRYMGEAVPIDEILPMLSCDADPARTA